ncbi:MAG TPA: hypothetical protein VFW08_02980 [bacterium]|nr:hypothetical protein [bacterium]
MNIGILLLAIWLILTGLSGFTRLAFPARDRVMGALALLAGIFLILNR